MSPQVKAKAKEIVGGLHQWMTLLALPLLTIMVGDMYHDFKNDHEDKIRKDEIISRHTEQIKELRHDVSYSKGQMNYVLNRLKVEAKLPEETIYQDN